MAEESEIVTAENRTRRRKKEKRANRAVTAGIWAVLIAIAGGVGALVYVKTLDHAGEKAWEWSDPGAASNCSARPNSSVLFFSSSDGTVGALDALTGKKRWNVKLPEDTSCPKTLIVDEDRCLAVSGNNLFLCASAQAVPVWEYGAPQPSIPIEPVHLDNRLYVASASTSSHYFPRSLRSLREPEELIGALSRLLRQSVSAGRKEEQEEGESDFSTITGVDMESGTELWRTRLENIRVYALVADGSRAYVSGGSPEDYGRNAYAGERREVETNGSEDAGKQEHLSSTQLWALNADTGEAEWKLEGIGSFSEPPVCSGNGIVFSTDENIYSVSPDGKTNWKYPLLGKRTRSMKPYDGKLFVIISGGFLVCLDLHSGQKRWMTDVGMTTGEIVIGFPLAYVLGTVKVEKERPNVIPTKRWEGSEDLLEGALDSMAGVGYEQVLYGIDIESGNKAWSIPEIEKEYKYANGILYALRYFERPQFLDASADPSELSKTITNLGAYDSMTGEKIWETAIDGYAFNLQLAQDIAVVTACPAAFSLATGGEQQPNRLIGISLN